VVPDSISFRQAKHRLAMLPTGDKSVTFGKIWSAVTRHRFRCFGGLSPKQGRVQRPEKVGHVDAFDGDKPPSKSADKSAHSRFLAASPRWEQCGLARKLRPGPNHLGRRAGFAESAQA
jgi:hypothetical protein